MIRNTRTAYGGSPALRCYLNVGTLIDLPGDSACPRAEGAELYHAIKAAGYQGVQERDGRLAHAAGLGFATSGRVNVPADADSIAKRCKDSGAECATLHVGWGIEDDDTVDRLVDAVLSASVRRDVPLYIETHRATITQDNWRTVKLVERHPEVRFNGDLSHWYTGHEMTYGDFERKLAFIRPVLDRVRFMHGRIGSSGCMQVTIGSSEDEPQTAHFKTMWTAAMRGFLRSAKSGDYLIFAPELLAPANGYARTFPGPDGRMIEESDRWEQALRYCRIARQCFDDATSND